MEIQESDDIEKYAGSDVVSRAETGDGRVSAGLASVGEVRIDEGIETYSCRLMKVEMTARLTER
jgi:hypothetical protein